MLSEKVANILGILILQHLPSAGGSHSVVEGKLWSFETKLFVSLKNAHQSIESLACTIYSTSLHNFHLLLLLFLFLLLLLLYLDAKVVVYEYSFFSACYMSHPFQVYTDFITLSLHLVYLFMICLAMLLVTQTRRQVVK